MKTLLFGLFAIFTAEYLALAEDIPFLGTDSDVAKLTQYMLDSKDGKTGAFPLAVKFEQIRISGDFNGVPLKLANNSLLFTAIRVGSDKHNNRVVTYYFTVEPKLPSKINATDYDWPGLLKNRKVTQYHIMEYLTVGSKMKRKVLYLSAQKGDAQ